MPNQTPSVIITQQRTLVAYAEVWHASHCLLQAGLAEPEGSAWQFLSCILLTSFAFEAYLNHVGEQPAVSAWNENDRRSVRKKLEKLHESLGIEKVSWECAPYKTIKALIEFRNDVAHVRSDHLTETIDGPMEWKKLFPDLPLSDWERLIRTPTFAQECRHAVELVLATVHQARGNDKELLFAHGMTEFNLELKTDPS